MSFGRLSERKLLSLLYPDIYPDYTLEDVRAKIRDSANKVLGAPVALEERAYQALEVTTRPGTTPTEIHIWQKIASLAPAMFEIHENLGLAKLIAGQGKAQTLDLDIHDIDQLNWERSLRKIFMRGDSLTETANTASRSGVISIRDLTLGLLSSSRQSGLSANPHDRRTNLVFRAIARASKENNSIWWTSRLENLSRDMAAALDKLYLADPSFGSQQFVMYHDGGKVRIRPFATMGAYQLQEAPLPDGSLWVARGNTIQPATRFSEQAISELEELINSDAKEQEFQSFFEENSEFLLAMGDYIKIHPQLIMSEDGGRQLRPDFFLEKIDSGFCDICDLKRANKDLVRYQKNRIRFRDSIMEAVAQLTNYKDWFDDRANRTSFYDRYKLRAFRPNVVVIIGRKSSFEDDVKRLELESNLQSYVTLKTYDDIVSGARRWRSIIGGAGL